MSKFMRSSHNARVLIPSIYEYRVIRPLHGNWNDQQWEDSQATRSRLQSTLTLHKLATHSEINSSWQEVGTWKQCVQLPCSVLMNQTKSDRNKTVFACFCILYFYPPSERNVPPIAADNCISSLSWWDGHPSSGPGNYPMARYTNTNPSKQRSEDRESKNG